MLLDTILMPCDHAGPHCPKTRREPMATKRAADLVSEAKQQIENLALEQVARE
jgi:hypothetical protein